MLILNSHIIGIVIKREFVVRKVLLGKHCRKVNELREFHKPVWVSGWVR